MFEAILFDLDGVIVNSGLGIASAANTALAHFGYNQLDEDLLISFIGNGAKRLIQDALTAAGENLETIGIENGITFDVFFEWYLKWYEKKAVDKTPLYKNIPELFETLKQKNIPCALVTSKPLAVTNVVLEHYNLANYFDAVICPELVTNLKPHPESLELAIKTIESKRNVTLNKEDILMVGDSASDIIAARNFGCKACAITGGLGNTEKLIDQKADIEIEFACELVDEKGVIFSTI